MLLIVGRTGSGKDYLSSALAERNYKVLHSYTTRPKRTPEDNSHIFVSEEEAASIEKATQHIINGYQYFTTPTQIKESDVCIVSPKAVYELMEMKVPLEVVYIVADKEGRHEAVKQRGKNEYEVFKYRDSGDNLEFSAFEKDIPYLSELINIELVYNDFTPNAFSGILEKYPCK